VTTATKTKFTARDMHRALWWHFTQRWAVLTEVTARAEYMLAPAPEPDRQEGALLPYLPHRVKVASERRIDVLLLRAAKVTGGIERIAIEIKVTRQDFLADVRNPDKQTPWRGIAHRHAYAVPEGLVAETELPAGSGLLVVRRATWGSGFTVRWARNAKKPAGHNPGQLPLAIQMDAFYRAARGEAKIKGHDASEGADFGDDPDELRAEVTRLRHENELLVNRVDREIEQRQLWQEAFGAQGCPPCGTCGEPLILITRSRRGDGSWDHRSDADKAACQLLRHAAAIRANNELPEARRMDEEFLWVPPPEPAEMARVSR
jgi:hypothetical protein